jgi:hypothetical protein
MNSPEFPQQVFQPERFRKTRPNAPRRQPSVFFVAEKAGQDDTRHVPRATREGLQLIPFRGIQLFGIPQKTGDPGQWRSRLAGWPPHALPTSRLQGRGPGLETGHVCRSNQPDPRIPLALRIAWFMATAPGGMGRQGRAGWGSGGGRGI